jgi:NitT/TauT family transport system substrate-binding protein
MKIRPILALAVTASLAFVACGGTTSQAPSTEPSTEPSQAASTEPSTEPSAAPEAASVELQLQWVPQAQFAGYLAAASLGYYEDENLTVTMLDGGPTIIPQQVGSAPDGPEFTISWVPKVLEARELGSDLVDIAQIFSRSGTLSVTWADTGLTGPCDLAGKKVGVWDFGNEFEVTAGLLRCGYTPGLENGGDPATQYQKVIQAFDMVAFLNREIDAAEAMIYNEYAQVLEATNPNTNELYQPDDMNVIDWNVQQAAMLQDAIFARASWLAEGNNRDVAVRFLRASIRGWIYCRDKPDECVNIVLDAGTALGAGHQAWQMNEINALIWPNQYGIGVLDPLEWRQSYAIAKQAGIITADPSVTAFDTSIVAEAIAGLADQNLTGEGFVKGTVAPTPGGE